ncbi:hypothetical protein CL634_02650 [bacterium]|nr:hypothetical protein [bacterium]|tara:strand:- start:302 stop:616 length:315 start_codon:yes stop_codon:yes gene_type:complete
MKKKNKHPAPRQYRIIYRAGTSVMKSKQYYSVFHSSEALEDIYHTFHAGKIHAKSITIYKVQEHNRFNGQWEDRMDKALENAEGVSGIILDHGKIVLRKKGGEK